MAKLLILESQTLKSMVEISIVLQQKKTIQDKGATAKPSKPSKPKNRSLIKTQMLQEVLSY